MKLAIAIVICAASVAEAGGHHCIEVSQVVGYQQCHRFGAWAYPIGMWWDLGASMLRFDPNPIEASSGALHVTSAAGDDRPVTARGVRFRNMVSIGAWYVGGEFDFDSITSGPQLLIDPAARTEADSGTSGFVVDSKLAVGRHARYGIWMFGAELAPGVRIAAFSTSTWPSSAAQAWFVLDAQVRGDIWIAPNFTLGASAAVDLVEAHDVSFAITFGMHLVPYDHTR